VSEIAWAIVVLAGAVLFASRGDGAEIFGVVLMGLGLVRLLFFSPGGGD
jgi:hypothetical protein